MFTFTNIFEKKFYFPFMFGAILFTEKISSIKLRWLFEVSWTDRKVSKCYNDFDVMIEKYLWDVE